MNRRKLVAAATRVAAMVRIAGILAAAGFVLGCDAVGLPVRMTQDVDVTVPWNPPSGSPPGGEDVEDQAQTLEEEQCL
jgi:hypothetical protein